MADENNKADKPAAAAAARPCAICGRPATLQYRPFCTKRCADVDLARWLGGRYAIPATEDDEEDGGESTSSRLN